MRYGLLETVRQYAVERLAASGDEAAARRAHAGHYLTLAERVEPTVLRAEHVPLLARLDDEHENLLAAFELLLGDVSDAEPALRLAGALLWWWDVRGAVVSGGELAERALDHPAAEAATSYSRARAAFAAGKLAVLRGANSHATALLERARTLALDAGAPAVAASALREAAFAQNMLGNLRGGVALLDDALELARAAGDRHVEAQILSVGVYDDREPSNQAVRAALAIFEELGDLRWSPVALNNLGNEDLVAGRPADARVNLEESVRQARLLGNESAMCFSGTTLVLACIEEGDLAAAAQHLDDLAQRTERLGFSGMAPYVLFDYALLASRTGRHDLAATLHGAADAELVRAGEASFDLAETRIRDADRERLRAALGIEEFERLAARGRALEPQQAIALTRFRK